MIFNNIFENKDEFAKLKMHIQSSKEYEFLNTNKHLGNNIALLTLGGSYSYGLDTENSDIDVRGVALNSKEDILTYNDFETIVDNNTDTTIYSFMKFMNLLYRGNPNIIELLGCKDYLYLSDIGQHIIDNRNIFITKHLISSYKGYIYDANNIIRSTRIEAYTETTNTIKHKTSKRMRELARLYYTVIDILSKGEIITYRKDNKEEYEFLKAVQNGDYLKLAGKYYVINSDYFSIISILDSKFNALCEHNNLPNQVNVGRYTKLIKDINLQQILDK